MPSTTPTSTAPTTKQHDENMTQQPQNHETITTTTTTRTKIREQYTPRHHDLLVILTDPVGSVGCVLCAVALHAEDVVIDCGLGPEHRECHDHARAEEHGEHAAQREHDWQREHSCQREHRCQRKDGWQREHGGHAAGRRC